MLKVAGLGLALLLVFQCCCWGLGTNFGNWSERGLSLPGMSDAPEDVPLPIPGLGATKVQVGTGPDFVDMPRYPGAQPAGQEIDLPGPLALALGQLKNTGSEFRLYQANAAPQIVSGWYKQQMPEQGWKQENLPFDAGQAALLLFTKPGISGFVYVAKESRTGDKTQIMMIRAVENEEKQKASQP